MTVSLVKDPAKVAQVSRAKEMFDSLYYSIMVGRVELAWSTVSMSRPPLRRSY